MSVTVRFYKNVVNQGTLQVNGKKAKVIDEGHLPGGDGRFYNVTMTGGAWYKYTGMDRKEYVGIVWNDIPQSDTISRVKHLSTLTDEEITRVSAFPPAAVRNLAALAG